MSWIFNFFRCQTYIGRLLRTILTESLTSNLSPNISLEMDRFRWSPKKGIFLYLLPPSLYYPKMGCRNSHACRWCSILTTQSVFKEGGQNRTLMTCMAIPTPRVFYSDSPFHVHMHWSVRVRGAVGACLAWWWKRWRYGLVNDILEFYRWADFWTPIFGNVGKISAWHKMRDDMHARETGSKTVIKIHKGPAI